MLTAGQRKKHPGKRKIEDPTEGPTALTFGTNYNIKEDS